MFNPAILKLVPFLVATAENVKNNCEDSRGIINLSSIGVASYRTRIPLKQLFSAQV